MKFPEIPNNVLFAPADNVGFIMTYLVMMDLTC